MKILQLGKFYPIFGGVEKVMWELTRGVSAREVECDMLCAGLKEEIPNHMRGSSNPRKTVVIRCNEHGNIIIVHAIKKVAATMIAPRMIAKLRRICSDYDIIQVHHPDPMAALALRLSGYKGKVILHWHSDIIKQKNLLKFYLPLQRWLIGRADVIVGTSPVYVKESPYLKDVQDKVTAIPIGTRPVKYTSDGAERVFKNFGGDHIVYSLGRLIGYKGYEYLVSAAGYLPDNYRVLIGGNGPLKQALQDQVFNSGLKDKVHLLGFVDDEKIASFYSACDCFVLSSNMKTEAFGIVQIEAMSIGKPVVATKIPGSGVSWVNEHGKSGLNVPINDAEALAKAIMQVCEDPERHERFCIGARERYEKMFTYEAMIDNFLALYKKLLEK